jgi:hypothetical protein
LLPDKWAIDWALSELNGVLGNLQHLFVDGLGLGGGHTDGPEHGWSMVRLRSRLPSEMMRRRSGPSSTMVRRSGSSSAMMRRSVVQLSIISIGIGVLLKSIKEFVGMITRRSGPSSSMVRRSVVQLSIISIGIGVLLKNIKEFFGMIARRSGPSSSMVRRSVVQFGIISIGIGVLLQSIKGFVELSTDVVKLIFVVGGITSSNEVIVGLAGFFFEFCFVDILLGVPLLDIWLEVFIVELCGISISLENVLLEILECGTIKDLIRVLILGGDSGD